MPLGIPSGTSIVEVFIISPNQVLDVPASEFLTPNIPGTTYKDTPCFSFLIEHTDISGRRSRALFDLGIRSDWKNLPPVGELCFACNYVINFLVLIATSRLRRAVDEYTDPHRS